MDYTRRMRELREDSDLTQRQFADRLGTSQTMYARYERGANELACAASAGAVPPLRRLCGLFSRTHRPENPAATAQKAPVAVLYPASRGKLEVKDLHQNKKPHIMWRNSEFYCRRLRDIPPCIMARENIFIEKSITAMAAEGAAAMLKIIL